MKKWILFTAILFAFASCGSGEKETPGTVMNEWTTLCEIPILSVSGISKAFVKPTEEFFAGAGGESRVYYRGKPPVTHFAASGNGRIIRD